MANRDLSPWRSGGQLGRPGFDPFTSFRQEMDRLFDDFFAPAEARSFAGPTAATGAAWPRLDVNETPEAYKVCAELPGVDPKDVNIELKDNALTLSGEKRDERREEDGDRFYTERSYGRFQRTIPLPAEVDPDRCEANFKDGLLTVTLAKNPQARDQARRIEIKPQA
ncbi:Hsp20/alpha crystallin family protein [Phenylobacterium terrae]|uniref:Hsp20/alpha crystallin family protein n=1 Tax=Phenylobacterium terrae TaxID=2665495 RepID=A0ABW4N6Z3_9CAUL